MSLYQFATGLLPLFREFIFGKRVRASETPEEWEEYKKERRKVFILRFVDWLAASPRALAFLLIILIITLAANVRLTQKLLVYSREEKTVSSYESVDSQDRGRNTIPLPSKAQKQQNYIDTMKLLDSAYEDE